MRKHGFFTLLVILFLFSLVSCDSSEGELTRSTEKAFKGMELYSWQGDDGQWSYAILFGTNRIKSSDEVLSHPLDIEGVKEGLCKLAPGEQVFWRSGEWSLSNGEELDLETPPQEIVNQVIDHAADCDVDLFIYAEDGN
jgi:hypothetical protein